VAEASLLVKIGADVTDINTKLALGESALRSYAKAARSAADEVTSAGASATAEQVAQLEQQANAYAKLKAEVVALRAEQKEQQAAAAGGSFGALRNELSGALSGVQALTSGLMGLGTAFTAALGVGQLVDRVERVAELGEQLSILSQRTGVSTQALAALKYAANQVNVPFEVVENSLRGMSITMEQAIINPSSKAAAAYKSIGISTEFLKANQNDLLTVFMAVANAFTAHHDKAQENIVTQDIFMRGGRELVPVLEQGADGLQRMAEEYMHLSGVWTPELADDMRKHREAVKQMDEAWGGFWVTLTSKTIPSLTNFANVLKEVFSGHFKSALIEETKFAIQQIETEIEELKTKTKTESGFWAWWDNSKIKTAELQLQGLKDRLKSLQEAASHLEGEAGTGEGTGAGTNPLPSAPPPKPAWDPIDETTAMEKLRLKIEQMKADWTELGHSQLDIQRNELAMLKEAEGSYEYSQKEKNAIAQQEAALRVQIATGEHNLTLKQMQEQTDTARAGSFARINAAQAEYNEAVRLFGEFSVQAEQSKARAVRAWQEEIEQTVRVRQAIASMNAEFNKIDAASAVKHLQAEGGKGGFFDMLFGDITAPAAKAKAEIAAVTNDLQSTMQGFRQAYEQAVPTGNFDMAVQKMIELRDSGASTEEIIRQLGVEDNQTTQIIIENLSKAAVAQRQYAAKVVDIQDAAAKQTQQAWEQALQPMGSAFDGLVMGYLKGTQTIRQGLLNAAEQITSSFLSMATKSAMSWVASELTKTSATEAGAAQRAAAENTESSGFFSIIGRMLSSWFGKEEAQTAATEAGAQARVAAETEANTEGEAAKAATASKSIMGDAYKAAAAVYANVAEIPYVGWLMAPLAAAGAFAAVAAYNVVSAEGGLGEVSADDTPALLHRQEMVLPASIASPLRAMVQGDTGGNAVSMGGAINVSLNLQALDGPSAKAFLMNHGESIVASLAAKLRARNGSVASLGVAG
jgi:hypothetical protein